MFPSKVDKKLRFGGSYVNTELKMSPVLSLALEPISSFSYQEYSVHVRTYAYVYS